MKLLGYRQEELLGQELELCIPAPFLAKTLALFRRRHVLGGPGNIVSGRQIKVVDKGGRAFAVELSLSWFQDSGEAVFIAILRDISNRVKRETELASRAGELLRANAELEQFVHFATRDLRKPLREVLNYTRLLADKGEEPLPEDRDRMLARAILCLELGSRRIARLLDYDRVRTGLLHFETVRSCDAIRAALGYLENEIDETAAQIAYEGLPELHADFGQLALLFQNLIANAIKFRSTEAPKIRISVQREDDEWLFEIHDNGIGIADDCQDEIFIIFHRVHDHDVYPGSGIGLAICEKIVQRHGGRIWVRSGLGNGASFFCALPVVPMAELSKNSTVEEAALPSAVHDSV